jgi:hypothetical protein
MARPASVCGNGGEPTLVAVHEGREPRAGGQRLGHQAVSFMPLAEHVTQLVSEDGERIHAVLLALVAGSGELRMIPACRMDEPAPAGDAG